MVRFWASALLRPVEPGMVLGSVVVVDMPFVLVGLFDADDCARWRDSGRADCAEFWRARDEGGRCGALALGIGLLRWGSFDSVDGPTTGDETRGGGPVAEVLVLFLYQVSSKKTVLRQRNMCVPFPCRCARRSTPASSFSRTLGGWCLARASCPASSAYSIALHNSAHRSFRCWHAIAGMHCWLLYPSPFVRHRADIACRSICDTETQSCYVRCP